MPNWFINQRRKRARKKHPSPWRRRFSQVIIGLIGLVVVVPIVLSALYTIVPPPITPLMIIRLIDGYGLHKDWTPLKNVSPAAYRAVIASEDNRFCQHSGIDWEAIEQVLNDYYAGKRLRGASTISMQVAKNVFLWPNRSYLRKALETYFTLFIETLWSKKRILEIYINVVEFGPGLYGIEAAAQRYFRKSSSELTQIEAAQLAVILPNPLHWSPHSTEVKRRAYTIRNRMGQITSLYSCI